MTTFKITKVVAYGAFLWLIVTGLVGSVYGFGLYCGITDSAWLGVVSALISGGISLIFAKEMGVFTTNQALVFSLIWLFVPIVIDLAIISPVSDQFLNSWEYWLGRGLIFLAPWIVYKLGKKSEVQE